jgi:hypothetical protein
VQVKGKRWVPLIAHLCAVGASEGKEMGSPYSSSMRSRCKLRKDSLQGQLGQPPSQNRHGCDVCRLRRCELTGPPHALGQPSNRSARSVALVLCVDNRRAPTRSVCAAVCSLVCAAAAVVTPVVPRSWSHVAVHGNIVEHLYFVCVLIVPQGQRQRARVDWCVCSH